MFLLLQSTNKKYKLKKLKGESEKNKQTTKTKNQKPSAGYYASPKLILLFFGVSVIPVQHWNQQINYNVQNNIFFLVIKNYTTFTSISTITYVQILQDQSLSV